MLNVPVLSDVGCRPRREHPGRRYDVVL